MIEDLDTGLTVPALVAPAVDPAPEVGALETAVESAVAALAEARGALAATAHTA